MAEARGLPLHHLPDEALVAELRGLGSVLAVPTADDLATRVRVRVAALPAPAREPWWRSLRLPTRPARRALVLAIALVLLIAAIAGAIRLGIPGIGIVIGPSGGPTLPPTPTAPASGLPLGSAMGLGRTVTAAQAAAFLGRPLPVIDDPAYGPPDAIYVQGADDSIVNQVWGPGPGRPPANSHGVSMLLTALPADIDTDFMKKLIDGGAEVEFLDVGPGLGFWIQGAHELLVLGPEPEPRVISLRLSGDVLAWAAGGLTYRMESSLGRDASVRLAERVQAP